MPELQHGLPASITLLISTSTELELPTSRVVQIEQDEVMRVEATERSRRLLPRIEFMDELYDWIDSSDDAAYGTMTRTIYLATAGRPKWYVAWCLLHELGHHIIEVVSGEPEWHFAYDDAFDRVCEKIGGFWDFVFRRK